MFDCESISSGVINVESLLDGLAAEQLALFVVLISEMFEYFEQLVDGIGALTYLTHIF